MKQMGNWEKKLTMQVMAALLASAAMGTTAFAAEAENSNAADTAVDVYELEDTVVTAERMPTKKLETPANTAVITAKEIEDNHYQSVDEAIGHVNGVSIVRMGGGLRSYVSQWNLSGIICFCRYLRSFDKFGSWGWVLSGEPALGLCCRV